MAHCYLALRKAEALDCKELCKDIFNSAALIMLTALIYEPRAVAEAGLPSLADPQSSGVGVWTVLVARSRRTRRVETVWGIYPRSYYYLVVSYLPRSKHSSCKAAACKVANSLSACVTANCKRSERWDR